MLTGKAVMGHRPHAAHKASAECIGAGGGGGAGGIHLGTAGLVDEEQQARCNHTCSPHPTPA